MSIVWNNNKRKRVKNWRKMIHKGFNDTWGCVIRFSPILSWVATWSFLFQTIFLRYLRLVFRLSSIEFNQWSLPVLMVVLTICDNKKKQYSGDQILVFHIFWNIYFSS
jgi:hypothetical protein